MRWIKGRRIDNPRGERSGASWIRGRLSYANVMSTIAIFGVLGGGGAYAASKIGPSDIKPNAVRAKHIKKNQVRGKHVREQTLDATPLATRAAQGRCRPAVPGTGQMVKVGSVCIDRYEASVWSRPNGGTQYGIEEDDYPCDDNGQDCEGEIYARSVPGVTPSRHITWFQAEAALAGSGKRLATNAEWQMAAAGTPESPGGDPCQVDGSSPVPTGSRAGCVSNHGASDMVGNVWELVAEWLPRGTCEGEWPNGFGDDWQGICGAATEGAPGTLIRGGRFGFGGANAGVFAVDSFRPSDSGPSVGLRGSR